MNNTINNVTEQDENQQAEKRLYDIKNRKGGHMLTFWQIIITLLAIIATGFVTYKVQQYGLKPIVIGNIITASIPKNAAGFDNIIIFAAFFNERPTPDHIVHYALKVNDQEAIEPIPGKEGNTTFIYEKRYIRLHNKSKANLLNQMRNHLTLDKPYWGFLVFPTSNASPIKDAPLKLTLIAKSSRGNTVEASYILDPKAITDLRLIENFLIENEEYEIIERTQ